RPASDTRNNRRRFSPGQDESEGKDAPAAWVSETNPGKDGSPFIAEVSIFGPHRCGRQHGCSAPTTDSVRHGCLFGGFGTRFRSGAQEAHRNDRSRLKRCLAAAGGCDAAPRQTKSSAAGRGQQAKDRPFAATDGGR